MCRPFLCASGHHCPEGLTCMLVFAIFSAVLGMFQFGFNTGVINAPQEILSNFIAEIYQARTGKFISTELLDLIWSITVSIFAVGGMIGGLSGGFIADWCGRKCGLLLNNAIAILGATLMSSSQLFRSVECLIIGRFFIGLNCGLNTHLVPMYLSEISPMNLRGALGTVSQLGVTIGLLLSQVLGLSGILGSTEGWPFLLGVAFVPAVLQLMLLPLCPESPRYLLITKGRISEARHALTRLRCTSEVDDDIEEMRMEESRASSAASNIILRTSSLRRSSRRSSSSEQQKTPVSPEEREGSFMNYNASPCHHYLHHHQQQHQSRHHHQRQQSNACSPSSPGEDHHHHHLQSPSSSSHPIIERSTMWGVLCSRDLRTPLMIAIVMQLSQQLSGINAIFYYSTDMFADAGLGIEEAKFATLGVGAVMVIMTLVSIPLMDKMGRRALHLWGLGGMFITSIFFTISLLVRFLYQQMSFLSIVSSLLFVVFFAVGPASIPWLITAELFSQGPRPAAMSIAVLINWSTNFIVGLTFPLMKRAFENYVFLPYTCFLAIFWTFTYHRVPETKNRTFDEISSLFRREEFTSADSFQTPCRKSVQSDIVYGTTTVTPVMEQQQPHLHHHPSQVLTPATSIPGLTTAAVDEDDSIMIAPEAALVGQHQQQALGHFPVITGATAGPANINYQQQSLAQPPSLPVLCQNAINAAAAASLPSSSNLVYHQQWTATCPAVNNYSSQSSQEYEL